MKASLILYFFLFASFSGASETRTATRNTVRKNISSLKSCYTEGLKTNPQLAGKVVLEWDVDDTGTVKRASVKSSTLNDAAVETCMIDKLKAIKFPPAAKGVTANITYPFVFSKTQP